VPLSAENYENNFPGLDALDQDNEALSPSNFKKASSTSPEPRSPTDERIREPEP